MTTCLMHLVSNLWQYIVDGYKDPRTHLFDKNDKKYFVNNSKAMNSIFYVLFLLDLVK